MLAVATKAAGWEWHAQGKHPALADFITLGRQCPVSRGLAVWIARSFSRVGSGAVSVGVAGEAGGNGGNGGNGCWQFWIAGASPDALICGCLAASTDSLGRPYPLLLLGRGSLPGWRERWSELPPALCSTWAAMATIARSGFGSIRELKQAVAAVPAPVVPREPDEARAVSQDGRLRFRECQVSDAKAIEGEIAGCLPKDEARQSALWLAQHAGRHAAPTAVFLGRCGQSTLLWLYARPLGPEDFLAMWSRQAMRGSHGTP
ncbi:TagF domain-containing protein [Desulfocurvibacter africanus]|uniref:TagF domain-containing protein n=1 Tax=Desulfocurvibacter africanus TaxID=873 RepID=UPI00059E9BAA|nr:TagF domain-containing protein [Desulfocurvibacter africanus]